MFRRHLLWIVTLTLLVPSVASAQFGPQSRVQQRSYGYDEGYDRGMRAGTDDARRGSSFNFSINVDFRRGDLGYRVAFGNLDRYRDEFRRAFQLGYQSGYGSSRGGSYDRGLPGARTQPGWGNGRGGRAVGRFDPASQQGYSDGYEAGIADGRQNRRYDPISERRYRSGDSGYNGNYGSRDRYKASYRAAFLDGYEEAYADVSRYDRRW